VTFSKQRIHYRRSLQTQRVIRAVSNPYTTILGHMTGPQLLRRPSYDIDIEKVRKFLPYARSTASPLKSTQIRGGWTSTGGSMRQRSGSAAYEHQSGCAFDTRNRSDALGRRDARKGGVAKERVLNCLSKEEFAEYLARRPDRHPVNVRR
jgi:DNA polymerase (family X)